MPRQLSPASELLFRLFMVYCGMIILSMLMGLVIIFTYIPFGPVAVVAACADWFTLLIMAQMAVDAAEEHRMKVQALQISSREEARYDAN